MINLPCNAASMSQVTPCQNVPVQTSQYNFPTCQQRQTSTQQMQTAACGPCSGVSQGPCTHVHQPETYVITHQCIPGTQPVTSSFQPVLQNPCSIPPSSHPGCAQLPQNILDQIRACVSNAAPIFILPGGCQQSPVSHQQPSVSTTLPQAMTPPPTAAYPSSGLTYPAACYPLPPPPPPPPPSPPPPSFYPYPVPLPFCDPFIRARETQNCGCCRRKDIDPEARIVARADCRYESVQDEHYCTSTTDDTICTKRNCPSSLHLQALASQFLSMQGIIPCAATRLVLRKVPGSNVTTTMEDTMAKAQKSINALTKDQLLSESKNAQHVNALINLHMTANPPPNIIPILTLVQLKMNLLKAQVEGLVNQRLMEIQGVGVEVETDLIDPTVLALKSDAELRDFLSVLRQKECDERVNVNFAPYRSQRAIAETRLNNVQNKIRQVEAEFDRRRCAMLPAPTLSSRIVQQFTGPCYSARFEDPRKLYSTLPSTPSPDPFAAKPRSPKRLLLKPYAGGPAAVSRKTEAVPCSSRAGGSADESRTRDRSVATDRRSSAKNCACCDRTTSEESVCEAKKKLRPRIVEIDATMSNVAIGSRETSLVKLTSNVLIRIDTEKCLASARKRDVTLSEKIPCESDALAGQWVTRTYVNVADDESVKMLTESESDTIILSERVCAEDVCVSHDAIAIRSFDRITDRVESAGSLTHLQQPEGEETKSAISERKEIKEHVPAKISQDVLKTVQLEETKPMTIAEVVDGSSVLSAQETERESLDGARISSLPAALKLKEEKYENELKNGNGETLLLSVNEVAERSARANGVPISKSKKKTRFHIVSLLTNIVYDKDKDQKERKVDEKMATSERGTTSVNTEPDIGKLHKYSSADSLLRNIVTRDITGNDRLKNIFPEESDLSKLHTDCQCQTVLEIAERKKKMPDASLKVNIFPPFKNLRGYATDNEKNEDGAETYPSPITRAGITAAKRLSCCNDVMESTLNTPNENNARYLSNVKRAGSFISGIFALIGDRVVTFISKIVTLNWSLYPSCGAMLRESLNIDIPGKAAAMYDQIGRILKDYDPPASTFHYPLDPNRGTSRSGECAPHDTKLLRVSTGEGYDRIRKIGHSIIEDEKNGTKYLAIVTSNQNFNSLLTHDFEPPYEVRRSLLIRSRLKRSSNLQDYPYPFSFLRRARKNVLESYKAQRNEYIEMIEKRKIYESNSNERFRILSKVANTSKNDGKISGIRNHNNEFVIKNLKCNDNIAKRISHKYLPDNIKSNVFIKQRHAVNNKLIINVYDYLGLQTEINANIDENRTACLLINDKNTENYRNVL